MDVSGTTDIGALEELEADEIDEAIEENLDKAHHHVLEGRQLAKHTTKGDQHRRDSEVRIDKTIKIEVSEISKKENREERTQAC